MRAMPLVKSLSDRVQKYTAKYSSDVVKTRLSQVQAIAEARYTDAVPVITTVREFTRNILETAGVPAGQHAIYYSFAFKLASKLMKHGNETAEQIVAGLKAEWETVHGADPNILDQIANLVKGVR